MAAAALSTVEQFYFRLVCLDCHEGPARVSRHDLYCYKCGKEKSIYLCKCGAGLGHNDRGKVDPYCSGCGTETSNWELTPQPLYESLTYLVNREMTLRENLTKQTQSRLRRKSTTAAPQSTEKSPPQNSARTAGESAACSEEVIPIENDNTATAVDRTPKNKVKTEAPRSSSKDKVLLCPLCQTNLSRHYLVKDHVETQHNNKRYQCTLCEQTQNTILRHRKHYRQNHPHVELPDDKTIEQIVVEANQWLKDKLMEAEKSETKEDKVESSSSDSSSSSSSDDESDSASVIYNTSKINDSSLPMKSQESPRQASINSEITSVDLQTAELTQKPPRSPNKKLATARRLAGRPVNGEPSAEKLDTTKKPTAKRPDQKKSATRKLETEPAEIPKSGTLIEKKKRAAEPQQDDGSSGLPKSPKRKQKKSDSDTIQTSPRKQEKKAKSVRDKPADKVDAGGDRDDEVTEVDVFECVICYLEFPTTTKLKRHYRKLHGSLDEHRMDF